MIKLCDKKDCTGCMACGNACRHNAIEFFRNEEGFLHPKINPKKCVSCRMCVRACPILTPCPPAGTQEEKRVFAAWSKDEDIRFESSSGGVFSVLAKETIARGGVVFGAAFDEAFSLRHIMVENEDGIKKLRGSKYVQSRIEDTFSLAEQALKTGRQVFFTGTPCQIAGLRMFLRKDYVNLLTADIVCHGVPSPMVFESYKKWLESRLGSPLGSYKFRDKRWSWKNFNTKAEASNGGKNQCEKLSAEQDSRLAESVKDEEITSSSKKKSKTGSPFIVGENSELFGTWQEDPWMRGFLREYFLREGCHSCRFANTNRPGDITLADYWGYRSRKGKFKDDDRGISMVMLNDEKGRIAFERIKPHLVFIETPMEEAVRGNPALSRCFPPSPRRAEFWRDFSEKGYEGTLEKYMAPESISRSLRVLYRFGRSSPQYLFVRLLIFTYSFPRRCAGFALRKLGLRK